jgi:hypothetical protein
MTCISRWNCVICVSGPTSFSRSCTPTRRDGSAIDRLLASRFAGISEVEPGAPQLPPPDEQPPPVNAGMWALAA